MKYILLFLIFFITNSCSNDLSEFFIHKNKMIKTQGPCNWKFVGKDINIDNPAIKITPPVGEEYVLWNQICANKK